MVINRLSNRECPNATKAKFLSVVRHVKAQSGYSMKPRGTNNAAENELTTPKALFGVVSSFSAALFVFWCGDF